MNTVNAREAATRIIQDAGGELIGRTRLQKVTYLAQLAGFAKEFEFEYRHYGPFSEDLARGMEIAAGLGDVKEIERQADWGGRYSIYSLTGTPTIHDQCRATFLQKAKVIDAIELELAATAAFIYTVEGIGMNGTGNPWEETKRRKPEKATDARLLSAAKAYETLRELKTPKNLPKLPVR